MSEFESLLGSMRRMGCDYESLDEKDKAIYDKLKNKHDEIHASKSRFFINNFPDWVDVSDERFSLALSDIASHLAESRVRFAFGEFSSVFEYRLYCLLFKSLCKHLNLRHCVYVEPQFDSIENFLGAETVGFFSGRQIESRHEGVLSHLLWKRLNDGYYTFVFTVKDGPKYDKFSTSIQDYFPNFYINCERMTISFKEISWKLK